MAGFRNRGGSGRVPKTLALTSSQATCDTDLNSSAASENKTDSTHQARCLADDTVEIKRCFMRSDIKDQAVSLKEAMATLTFQRFMRMHAPSRQVYLGPAA